MVNKAFILRLFCAVFSRRLLKEQRKMPAWIQHRNVRVYTVNTLRLQIHDTAEVHIGPIESGKSVSLLLVPYGLARCVMRCKHGRLYPTVSCIRAGAFLRECST